MSNNYADALIAALKRFEGLRHTIEVCPEGLPMESEHTHRVVVFRYNGIVAAGSGTDLLTALLAAAADHERFNHDSGS